MRVWAGGDTVTSMVSIGSVYGHGFGEGERARLRDWGFELRPTTSIYPGSQLCSFLDFQRGPSLELIEVLDPAEYETFAPAGMEPYCPGISLVAESPVWALDDLEHQFAGHDPYRLHVGYDGSSEPAAPGWTYLNFAKPVLPGAFVWCTTFDEPRPSVSHRRVHPNGVSGVVGLVFDSPIQELRRLAELASADLSGSGMRIGETEVWTADAIGLPGPEGKRFPLVAIVLRAPSPDQLSGYPDAAEIALGRRPAVHLRTNDLSWDLVIVG